MSCEAERIELSDGSCGYGGVAPGKFFGFFTYQTSRDSIRHAIDNKIHYMSDLELDNEFITISFVENLNC